MSQSDHILGSFDEALSESKSQLLEMASITRRNLENAVKGLLERNTDLCNQAIADDEEVNSLEREVDRNGLEILIKFNPMASDLRAVLAGMKIANNLERVADQAENIGKRAKNILKFKEVKDIRKIEPIFNLASKLIEESLSAYIEGDVELGLSLYNKDQELDKMHNKLIKELTKTMEKNPVDTQVYLNLIFILRSLERIGDHAVNIGEDAVFVESAKDIRHIGPDALEEEE